MELTLSDISAFNGEPTILDLKLAELLGYELRYDIRKLIKRNHAELAQYGEVFAMVAKTPLKGGRPGVDYYLNEGQALLIAMLSNTANAAQVRKALITVFMQWRRGELVESEEVFSVKEKTMPPINPQDIDMERAPLSAKVDLLRFVERNFGRRRAVDYMSQLGLPVPPGPMMLGASTNGAEEASECLHFLLDWQADGGLVSDLLFRAIDGETDATAALERIGMRATPEGAWLVAAHDGMKTIWHRTKWRGIWRTLLRRLPGVTDGHERMTIGGHQGRPLWLPATLFRLDT